jgi:putative peptidoglycan lipid II flippase
VAANVALNLLLIGPLAHVGIALGTAIAAWGNALALALLLARRRRLVIDRQLRRRAPRLLLAALAMAAAIGAARLALPDLAPLLLVPGLIAAGAVAYFAAAQALGAIDWRELRGLLRRRRAPAVAPA